MHGGTKRNMARLASDESLDTRNLLSLDETIQNVLLNLPSKRERNISIKAIAKYQEIAHARKVSNAFATIRRRHLVDAIDNRHLGSEVSEHRVVLDDAEKIVEDVLTPVDELAVLREMPDTLANRKKRRKDLLHLVTQSTSSVEQTLATLSNVAVKSGGTVWNTARDALASVHVTNIIKKKVQAEAGASVAAVFDLGNDLIFLNLILTALLFSSLIIPTFLWYDNTDFNGWQWPTVNETENATVFDNPILESELLHNFVEDSHHTDETSALKMFPPNDIDRSNTENIDEIYLECNTYNGSSKGTDQYWGWLGVNTSFSCSDDNAFDCSGVFVTAYNLQTRFCSSSYIKDQETYKESRTNILMFISDWLKGTGFLERTPLFTGWYPVRLSNSGRSYTIYLAYLLTMFSAYLISFCYVVKLFARWLMLQREFLSISDSLSNMIFRGWDFTIVKQKLSSTEQKLLATEIEAAIFENKHSHEKYSRTEKEQRYIFFIRILIHLLSFLLIIGGWFVIYRVITMEKGDNFFEQYIDTLTIGGINFIFPVIFFFLSQFEKYRSRKALLLRIMRTVSVRLLSIIIVVVSEISTKVRDEDGIDPCVRSNRCWETHLAQQIYSLLIFDAIFHFPIAIVVFLRHLSRKVSDENCVVKRLPKVVWEFIKNPEFDTEGQVIRIVNLQTLCWTGLACAPMIPLIAVLSLLIMIFLNGATVYFCDLRPDIVFRTSTSSSTFILALFIGFLISLVPSILIFVNLKPSMGCSPFRGLKYPYESLVYEMCKTPEWIQNIWFYLDNVVVYDALFMVILLLLVYFISLSKARKAHIKQFEKRLKIAAFYKRTQLNTLKMRYKPRCQPPI